MNDRTHLKGFTLLEAAISIALLGILLIPLTQWLQTESAAREQRTIESKRTMALEAVEAYILAHQRLPCPAQNDNGSEQWSQSDGCDNSSGRLPSTSLGLAPQFAGWRYSVATLEQLGPPAQNMLQQAWMNHSLPINVRDEIILKPISPNAGLEDTALPALHLCHLDAELPWPSPNARGCGSLSLMTPTGVAVILPPGTGRVFTANQPRSNQFLVSQQWDPENPIWISYERYRWLLRNH